MASYENFGEGEGIDDALQRFGGLSSEEVAELASVRKQKGNFDFFLHALEKRRACIRQSVLIDQSCQNPDSSTIEGSREVYPDKDYPLMDLFARVPFRP